LLAVFNNTWSAGRTRTSDGAQNPGTANASACAAHIASSAKKRIILGDARSEAEPCERKMERKQKDVVCFGRSEGENFQMGAFCVF